MEAKKDPDRKRFDLFPSDRLLVMHAHVYAVAEKYDIAELKSLACDKFITYYEDEGHVDSLTSEGLHDALETILEPTPESDKLLRSAALKILKDNLTRNGIYPRLEDIIYEFPEVGIELTSWN
jgi:hypothetical protein